MRKNKTLLDDLEKIYVSIPCTLFNTCECCKNKRLCDKVYYLMYSIRNLY